MKQKNEEKTKEYQVLKRMLDDVSSIRDKTLTTLVHSERRQKELTSEIEQLKANVEDQRQQLESGKESRLRLESELNRLKEENKKLEESNKALLLQTDMLRKKNENLKAINESLELRAKKQSESGHEMNRRMSDLSRKLHESQTATKQFQRQHNSSSDSCIHHNEVKFSITPPSEQAPADMDNIANTRTRSASSEANLTGQSAQNASLLPPHLDDNTS